MRYREKCLIHKGDVCKLCGSEDEIEVHHIDGDRKNNKLVNLMPVCTDCHNKIHSGADGYEKWNGKLIDRRPEKELPKITQQIPNDFLESVSEFVQWMEKHGEDVDSIIRLEQLRREHSDVFVELTATCRNENRRKVVAALLHNDGKAQYDDLEIYTSCTHRTIKNHIYDLRDKGIIEVEESRPAVISFASEPIEILAEDILSKFYSTLE